MSLTIKPKVHWKIEVVIILCSSVIVYILASKYDVLESIVNWSRKHEHLELDEIITVTIFLVFALSCFALRRLKDLWIAKNVTNNKNIELQKALAEIKELKGYIPICSSCKSIRNDQGYWQKVEVYIQNNTDALFTHGLCPGCIEELYPEFSEAIDNSDTES